MKRYNIVMLVSVLFVSAISLPASARLNSKIYSGSTCTSATFNRTPERTNHGNIFHSKNYRISWNCPITREYASATKISRAWIYAIDDNRVGDIRCRLYSRSKKGNVVYQQFRKTVGASHGVQTLKFSNLSTVTWGNNHINCSVPKYKRDHNSHLPPTIISYAAEENY